MDHMVRNKGQALKLPTWNPSHGNITVPERPIYYDTVGKIELIHDEWTLHTYYNLTNYWQDVQHIEKYVNGVNDLCQSIHQSSRQAKTDQLSHEMKLLNFYNTFLLAAHKHISMRKKRGLIDGVGMVANSLFGVLDQKFADNYHRDIDDIQTQENIELQTVGQQPFNSRLSEIQQAPTDDCHPKQHT